MVERIFRQLAEANENLTGNVLKTIAANKVKEQIYMHEVQSSVIKMINQIMIDAQ